MSDTPNPVVNKCLTTEEREAAERPKVFRAEEVLAALAGRKTHFREVVKPQPEHREGDLWAIRSGRATHELNSRIAEFYQDGELVDTVESHLPVPEWLLERGCPYGKPGDRLWVRETWMPVSEFDPSPETGVLYRADGEGYWPNGKPAWKPSIHMPRWASRLTLEVTVVRVERLREISHDDCLAEGVSGGHWVAADGPRRLPAGNSNARNRFCWLWDSINGKSHPWSSNPWVWCVEFERVNQEADG